MKSKHPHARLLLLVLTLAAQLILFAPAASAGQNTSDQNRNMGIPYNRRCRQKCQNNYRRCIGRGNSQAYCRRLRSRCLNRCPQ